jgi:YggT family protein
VFIAANLIEALAIVLRYILDFYWWVLIIRALLSWVNPDPWNPIVQFLQRVTDPILAPIQRRMRSDWMGIDLSPMVAILIILFLKTFLIRSLFDLASQFRL